MLRIELLGDGGIRVEPPAGVGGLASERMAREWIDSAAEQGDAVEITGETTVAVHTALVSYAAERLPELSVQATAPAPWPDGWSSLQIAANSGLAEQSSELAIRDRDSAPRRGPRSPYRLAMYHGHVDTLVALRQSGVAPPPGSRPPDDLPNAVVLRNYLPAFVQWVAVACAVAGVALAVVLGQWPFLILAAFGAVAVAVGNALVGLTRIAVDGRMLAVRHIARWQGPIDLGELVAVGYAPAASTRMSGRWRFVQTVAGPPYGRTAYQGIDRELAERLTQRSDLRVMTVYCNRGFLSPGFQRHVAPIVQQSSALVSSTAEQVFALVNGPIWAAERPETGP